MDSLGVLPIKSKVQEFLKMHLCLNGSFQQCLEQKLVCFFTARPRYWLAQLEFV